MRRIEKPIVSAAGLVLLVMGAHAQGQVSAPPAPGAGAPEPAMVEDGLAATEAQGEPSGQTHAAGWSVVARWFHASSYRVSRGDGLIEGGRISRRPSDFGGASGEYRVSLPNAQGWRCSLPLSTPSDRVSVTGMATALAAQQGKAGAAESASGAPATGEAPASGQSASGETRSPSWTEKLGIYKGSTGAKEAVKTVKGGKNSEQAAAGND